MSYTGSSLLSNFDFWVRMQPSAIAFDIDGAEHSYESFASIAQGIRNCIAKSRIQAGTPIAIYATQTIHTYAAIIGILASGHPYMPVNPAAPLDRSRSHLTRSGATLGFFDGKQPAIDQWQASNSVSVAWVGAEDIVPAPWEPLSEIDSEQLAYLLFTSGSTGQPKGVPIYHRNLNAFLDAILSHEDWGFTSSDRVMQMFDLTFDLSVMCYAVPLCVGGTCVVVGQSSAGFLNVTRTLRRGNPTVALMVPSVLSFLESYLDEIRLPSLRISLFCGEALSYRLAKQWRLCAPRSRVINVYGPTEATIFLSAFELSTEESNIEQHNGTVSIGRPLYGSDFRIVDDAGVELAEGVTGELMLLGPQVTTGYWQDADRTKQAFVTLPENGRGYKSGDLAFKRGHNYYYVGRVDNQFKIDGYRVEAGEIEDAARSLRGIRDAVLIPMRSDDRVIATHLFLRIDESDRPSVDATMLRDELAKILPRYMVPTKLHVKESFPLNQNGKIDRKALEADLHLPQ